ncbi:MAG: L-2-amino-thiazoline-4-carboxylic acid hydrolase [Chitinophagaceae bacterium]
MTNYKKYFTQAVRNTYPGESDFLMSEIEDNYKAISQDTRFSLTSSNPIDRRLDFCAYFLALIKTLDAQEETYDTIRTICLEIVLEYIRPKNKIQVFLKRLPAKLTNTWLATLIFKILNKKFSQRANVNGFVAKIITDKNETFGLGYGFDILECGICKLFKKYHFEKYSSILCEVDEITSALAGLKLIRTGTIALGAKKCDFRFKKNL